MTTVFHHTHLVNSECAKRQKPSILVNKQNLTVQNQVGAVLKRLRYILLQVLHLKQSRPQSGFSNMAE